MEEAPEKTTVVIVDDTTELGKMIFTTADSLAMAGWVWNEDTTGNWNQGTFGYEATGAGQGSPWSSVQRRTLPVMGRLRKL